MEKPCFVLKWNNVVSRSSLLFWGHRLEFNAFFSDISFMEKGCRGVGHIIDSFVVLDTPVVGKFIYLTIWIPRMILQN